MTTTIFAPATGPGRAAIAVIRMSGPGTADALMALAGPLPAPRMASLRTLRDPTTAAPLDRSLLLWFPAPHSFTGEDCAEFHIHGGRAVLAAVLATLGACPGCRLAEPGEFTRRAFLNGKMDLAAVEGLADLIDAETEAQRRQAFRQHEGVLAAWIAVQRGHLLDARAAAESAIDFSDEPDVAGDFGREVQRHVGAMARAIGEELARGRRSAHIRDGFVVALAGPPNAGKSTLLNALARREVAIVSERAGTTRDPIDVHLDLDGYLVHVVDTAGLRPTEDPVEQLGVQRAMARAQAADLVLWLSDARTPTPPDPTLAVPRLWRIATKADLAGELVADPAIAYVIVAPTGEGLPGLIDAIKAAIDDHAGGEAAVTTRERHRVALVAAEDALSAIQAQGDGISLELAAEQLRFVADRLNSLLGKIDTEAVLGVIFARFCVGK